MSASSAARDAESPAPPSSTPDLITHEPATAVEVQQKYEVERNKRIRSDGLSQYVDLFTSDKFKSFQADPWIDPSTLQAGVQALTEGSHCKYLVLGAGFGGLLVTVRLIQAGIDVNDIRIVDSAGGFGGTWYWNRYPGLMCDVESYIYMPLLEEMDYMPKHKYSYGSELREYAESIADKWCLRDKATFGIEVNCITWDDVEKEWVVKMSQKLTGQDGSGMTVRSQCVVSASGLLNCPKLPNIPGVEKFQGHSFHTSRWNYSYTGGSPTDTSLTNLKDKKVAIIGTGATAVQSIPQIAKWAKELYVFQRTPSSVDRRDNRPTDAEWWNHEVRGKRGWQRERMENFNAHLCNSSPRPPTNMVADGWANMPSFSALIGGPGMVSPEAAAGHVAALHAMDLPRQERIRTRVDQIVKDKTTAENLKAWYPGWCKRPCFHDDYLPTFNRPNVTLVDTGGKGVDEITENSIVFNGSEYEADLLIFSTGFRSPSVGSPASKAGMTVTGRNGLSLDRRWDEGVSTLHGVMSNGFPNLFWLGPFQAAATANHTFVLDQLATHLAHILSEAARKATQKQSPGQKFTVEPAAEAEEEWSMQILTRAAAFAGLVGCTPGYLNMEGEMDRPRGREEQMKAARGAIWGAGIADYVKLIEAWRVQGGLKGLEVISFC